MEKSTEKTLVIDETLGVDYGNLEEVASGLGFEVTKINGTTITGRHPTEYPVIQDLPRIQQGPRMEPRKHFHLVGE